MGYPDSMLLLRREQHRQAAERLHCVGGMAVFGAHERAVQAACAQALPPLAAWPAFNRHTHRIDLLHTLDHNGVAGVVLGNVFWAHLRRPSLVLPGDTQEGRTQFLNDDIRGFYHQNSVANRMPRLNVSNAIRRG